MLLQVPLISCCQRYVTATFANPFPSANAASYTATIDWGDGSTSAGTITGTGTLAVSGSHTYADPGVDAITVVINVLENDYDPDGGTLTVTAVGGPGPTHGTAALITSGPAGADGLYRPAHGVLEGKTKAWAHDVSLLGGAIHIDSVAVDGASAVSGLPGAQRTLARVTLHNVDVGGTTFSLEGDRLMIGGQPQALDGLPARGG